MRISLASALAVIACLGCGSGGMTAGSGGSGGDQSSGGSGGSATGGATGAAGHATGGTTGGSTGGASGGTTGGSTGGAAGRGTGGASGGAAGRGTGGAAGGAGGRGTGGATGGAAGHPASGGATGTGGTTRDAGTTTTDGGSIGPVGNPNGSCSAGVPSSGNPVDVSNSPTVVGSGTPGSCTFSALNTAVGKAGIITFNCGPSAVTIPITATMKLLTNKDTVIDGGNKVTLDGGHAVQIFNYNTGNFQATETRVTLQRLALINGKTTPTMPFPTGPEAACSQGYFDGQGGAIFMRDGNLTVIDCLFDGNQAAQLGPDTGGGAIYMEGSKHGAIIVGSTFTNNSGANGGAVGALFAELDIYNSLFENNKAVGHDANTDDSSMCSIVNNPPQHEVGSGGNGGAICGDGNDFNITLCGDAVLNNAAGKNAFGGGLFFTSDNWAGILTLTDTTVTGNTGGSWTSVKQGSVTNIGSAFGVNALSITVTNSTLQK
jgi:predicted outer membrane repeat protein